MKINISVERLSSEAYIEFLGRTDVGTQYPKERFERCNLVDRFLF